MKKYRVCAFLTSIEWQVVEAENEEDAREKYFANEGTLDDIDVTERDIDSIREMNTEPCLECGPCLSNNPSLCEILDTTIDDNFNRDTLPAHN